MELNVSKLFSKNQVVAVATSGGSDSMALLHYLFSRQKEFEITVIALNVEHGIRGESSKRDSLFVKNYCEKHKIKLLSYVIDTKRKVKSEKLSVEEAARVLRYDCFFDAINTKQCDVVATAHHLRDNAESVLLNIFRGTGIKGVTGINPCYENKIIRPFLNVSKERINEYIKENAIPFVADESNFCTDYTRNFLRLNVLPKIKEIFPEAESTISRLTKLAKMDDDCLDNLAKKSITVSKNAVEILLPQERAIFYRACVLALKNLGVTKDYEKTHVDLIFGLINAKNGTKLNMPKQVVAIKEYDKIVLYKEPKRSQTAYPFALGSFEFFDGALKIEKCDEKTFENFDKNDLSTFFIDGDKLPNTTVIRTKLSGDVIEKFGGGTKKLKDYFIDKKIPQRTRNHLPLIANGSDVYYVALAGIAEKVKIDEKTKNILKITFEREI